MKNAKQVVSDEEIDRLIKAQIEIEKDSWEKESKERNASFLFFVLVGSIMASLYWGTEIF